MASSGSRIVVVILLGAAPFSSACLGSIEGSAGDDTARGSARGGDVSSPSGVKDPRLAPTSDDATRAGAAPAVAGCPGMDIDAGPAPVRRLTRREYNNTVRDLLGETGDPASQFQDDAEIAGFTNNAQSPVTIGNVRDYAEAAKRIAQNALARLSSLLPCQPAGGEEACAQKFVATFGKRAFRRPLLAEESAALMSVYADARARGHDFPNGIRLVISAALASASFIHHVERGQPVSGTDARALSPHELASRLSYFVWQTMPDEALLAAADAGTLSNVATLETHARRLLGDARARPALRDFYEQWLDVNAPISKDAKRFPAFTAAAGQAMVQETKAFIDFVMWQDGARLETLLTAPYSFINEALARIYRPSGEAITGTNLRRVDFDPSQRAGLLTQAGFLASMERSDATQTDPIHRGLFVRQRLLCQDVPPPTAEIANLAQPPPENPNLTTRQRYESQFRDPLCLTCHQLINPIGLGMENYDALGQYRTTENALPIDARGVVSGWDPVGCERSEQTRMLSGCQTAPLEFNGLVDLSRRLATSGRVRDCVARQWLGFALGSVDPTGQSCNARRLAAQFTAANGNLRELLLFIVKSDGFRYRPAFSTEGCR